MLKSQVVLVYPPSEFEDKPSESGRLHRYQIGNQKLGTWPPLGIMSLSAVLTKEGISCEIVNPFVSDLTLRQTVNKIGRFSPKLVGISITTLQIRGAVQLARAIKKKFGKKVKVCVGGPHVSVDPDFVKRFDCFDFGLAGEAEISFPKVVKKVLSNERVSRYINSELPMDLNDLPSPDRKKIKIKDYFPSERPLATMVTSRGCPFRCLFCSRVAISDRVRFRSPKKVVDEIAGLAKEYDNNFTFLDDTFTLKRDHTWEICGEILKRKLKINWSCNTRANLLDKRLVKKMKQAGCSLILVGVETGDEKFRNEVVRKNVKDREIRRTVKVCKEVGVEIGGYFMLGFPGETKELLWKTASSPKRFDLDLMSIHATTVYPGSEIFELAQQESGLDYLDLWYQFADGKKKLEDLPLVYVPSTMDFSEIQKARRAAYFKFYFRPNFILKQVLRDLTSFKDLKRDFYQALMLIRFGKTSKDLK